jgi:mannose-6-phosphate isomerase-like protein (cupin superfamily)
VGSTGVFAFADLPGDDVARRFEGDAHGAGLSFFLGDFPAGAGPRLHRHAYEETFVIEDGGATFTVDGETLDAAAGQVVVVPAGAAHRFVTGERGCRFVSLHPAGRIAQEWLEG